MQPFDLEILDIITKEKNAYVTEQDTLLNIQGFEKDKATNQRVNYIFEKGEKRSWENLDFTTENAINFEKTPNNFVEQKDAIEIVSPEKETIIITNNKSII